MVRVPLEKCFQEAVNPTERLKKIPERFPVVEHDSATSRLKLQVLFLGRSKDLTIHILPDKAASKIDFEIVEGWLKGTQGVLLFSDYQRQQVEVGLVAKTKNASSWLPDFIFSTLIEAVMHHVSLSLRNDLEKDYKN